MYAGSHELVRFGPLELGKFPFTLIILFLFLCPPYPLKGVPKGATANTVVATYNDLANVEELIKDGDVAAVILEPVVGNSGFIKPTEVKKTHSVFSFVLNFV